MGDEQRLSHMVRMASMEASRVPYSQPIDRMVVARAEQVELRLRLDHRQILQYAKPFAAWWPMVGLWLSLKQRLEPVRRWTG